MSIEQQIVYHDESYKVLGAEQEVIVHPSVFGILPLNKASLQQPFSSEFHIEDYRLILDKLTLMSEDHLKVCSCEKDDYGCEVSYNGAVLIGSNLVNEYYFKGKIACFSYQNVYELVFDNGRLMTTIDQSKAMLRIRKNIDLGLRSLNNNRDLRCIKRFLNAALVGDYNTFQFSGRRLKYIKTMQKNY